MRIVYLLIGLAFCAIVYQFISAASVVGTVLGHHSKPTRLDRFSSSGPTPERTPVQVERSESKTDDDGHTITITPMEFARQRKRQDAWGVPPIGTLRRRAAQ